MIGGFFSKHLYLSTSFLYPQPSLKVLLRTPSSSSSARCLPPASIHGDSPVIHLSSLISQSRHGQSSVPSRGPKSSPRGGSRGGPTAVAYDAEMLGDSWETDGCAQVRVSRERLPRYSGVPRATLRNSAEVKGTDQANGDRQLLPGRRWFPNYERPA